MSEGLAPGSSRERGNTRQKAGTHIAHVERRDAQPSAAVEGVEVESRRDKGSESILWYRPVHKEQVVPAHKQHPRARRHGVRSVPRPAQDLSGSRSLHDLGDPIVLTSDRLPHQPPLSRAHRNARPQRRPHGIAPKSLVATIVAYFVRRSTSSRVSPGARLPPRSPGQPRCSARCGTLECPRSPAERPPADRRILPGSPWWPDR
jgi:hypothetical protein